MMGCRSLAAVSFCVLFQLAVGVNSPSGNEVIEHDTSVVANKLEADGKITVGESLLLTLEGLQRFLAGEKDKHMEGTDANGAVDYNAFHGKMASGNQLDLLVMK
jgi:hypothetical protein